MESISELVIEADEWLSIPIKCWSRIYDLLLIIGKFFCMNFTWSLIFSDNQVIASSLIGSICLKLYLDIH